MTSRSPSKSTTLTRLGRSAVGLAVLALWTTTVSPGPLAALTEAGSGGEPDSSVASCPAPDHTPGGADGNGGCWPGLANTGVPDGTLIQPYTGSCSITEEGVLIEERVITCELVIAARDVVIRRSQINGTVTMESGSLLIEDSEIVRRDPQVNGYTMIGDQNFTVIRSEIIGGNRGVLCSAACVVRDSWIHGQFALAEFHVSAIRMAFDATLIHNSIACDVPDTPEGGGCSGGLVGYGDFEPVENNLIQNNLFVATPGGFCAYGGSSGANGVKPYGHLAANIDFIGNVFQRGPSGICGFFGPVTDFDPGRPGNSWVDNRWSTGEPIEMPPG